MYKKLFLILVGFTLLTLTAVSGQTTTAESINKPLSDTTSVERTKTKDVSSQTQRASKPATNKTSKASSMSPEATSLRRKGFSIQPYVGLSTCLPSGKADCSHWLVI